MMIALFAMIAFVTNLCSPMAKIVKEQFGASNFAAQIGNYGNFIAYLIMGIPAGMLIKKYGYKKTALAALAVGMVGIFVQWLSGMEHLGWNFGIYLLGAFIAGLCMCMLNTVVNPMLNLLGGGGKTGNQLIQIGSTFNSAAAVAVYIIMGALIGSTANPTIKQAEPALFIAFGVFAVAFLVLLATRIKEPVSQVEAHNDKNDKYSAFSFRHFKLGMLAIFMYMGVEVGIPTYLILYLSNTPTELVPGLGIPAATATLLGAIYWLCMMIGRFIGGVIGGKVSSRAMILTVSVGVIVLVFLGMLLQGPDSPTLSIPGIDWANLALDWVNVPVGVFILLLAGLCTSVMWGGIFNLATEGLGKYTSIASGAFMTMVFGCSILVGIEGLVADIFHTYASSYCVVILCAAYIFWYALSGYRNVNKDIPVD